MAHYIPGSGAISWGDASGSSRSLARVRDLKETTSVTSQMSMHTLVHWFQTYVDPAGDPQHGVPATGHTMSWSGLHGLTIFGVACRHQSETLHEYTLSNDAQLQVYGLHGSGAYAFGFGATTYYTTGGGVFQINNLNAEDEYTLRCLDQTTNAEFYINFDPGYSGYPAGMVGTSTMGTLNQSYTFGTNSSTSWSEWKYFWLMKPTSKLPYG